jgi:hypothetical protein
MRSLKELAQEEIRMRSKAAAVAQEHQYSALRDIYPLEEKRPVSALRGLLDAIPEQPKPTAHQSALSGILGVQK